MSRAKAAAAALALPDIPNLPAPGSTITREEALDIAKRVGAKLLRDAKAAQKAKRDEVAAGVGGQITRIDESVVEQGQRFMARLALISQSKKSGSHSSASPLDPLVKQMGAIVGALQAMMLTDRTIGLFEDIRDYDFEGSGYYEGGDYSDPALRVGAKARDVARDVLAQFTIAEASTKSVRGKRGQKNVTPAVEHPLDDDELEEAALEGMDQEDGI